MSVGFRMFYLFYGCYEICIIHKYWLTIKHIEPGIFVSISNAGLDKITSYYNCLIIDERIKHMSLLWIRDIVLPNVMWIYRNGLK